MVRVHIRAEPNLASYTVGQSVTLTAVPDLGNLFAGWSGDTANFASNPLTFAITSNKTITATFSSANTPLVIDAITVLGNGHVQFNVTGPAAASMIIEAVGALGETWVPLQTNSPFTGTFTFAAAHESLSGSRIQAT